MMEFERLASTFLLTAVLALSLVGFCTQMRMPCVINCSHDMFGMSDQRMHVANGCLQDSKKCPMSMTDHMTLFTSIYPSIATDSSNSMVSLVAIGVFAWLAILTNGVSENEKLKAKMKNFVRRLANSIRPYFLIFAFSQGILHPKRHA